MAVFIQAVEQAVALFRRQAVAMQQNGGGLEGLVVLAPEDFIPVKPQQTVLQPFVAVDQDKLAFFVFF